MAVSGYAPVRHPRLLTDTFAITQPELGLWEARYVDQNGEDGTISGSIGCGEITVEHGGGYLVGYTFASIDQLAEVLGEKTPPADEISARHRAWSCEEHGRYWGGCPHRPGCTWGCTP